MSWLALGVDEGGDLALADVELPEPNGPRSDPRATIPAHARPRRR
jgi:hypothetical protein